MARMLLSRLLGINNDLSILVYIRDSRDRGYLFCGGMGMGFYYLVAF